ncbi:hypothetical protein [Candidatus Cyanaurora vandensis]|uniref:hypothetical protein n=1 Tax=Candidatus Cyanaurora vandensis TaxID=2714958 RepID=UPI00257CB991|nr:hypothetical protein [Candidatus Cyanaurora vandensis]
MKRRAVLLGLGASPVLAQDTRTPRLFNQKFDAVYLPGQYYTSIFLPSLGASRISAIVYSEVQGTAFLDVTNNEFDTRDVVFGVVEQVLPPTRSVILSIPAEFLVFQRVRLRVFNEDKRFGWVRGTLSVWT